VEGSRRVFLGCAEEQNPSPSRLAATRSYLATWEKALRRNALLSQVLPFRYLGKGPSQECSFVAGFAVSLGRSFGLSWKEIDRTWPRPYLQNCWADPVEFSSLQILSHGAQTPPSFVERTMFQIAPRLVAKGRGFHSSAAALGRPWKRRDSRPVIHAAQKPAATANIDFSSLGLTYAVETPTFVIERHAWAPQPVERPKLPFMIDRTEVRTYTIHTLYTHTYTVTHIYT
jgi:hypothetical protein